MEFGFNWFSQLHFRFSIDRLHSVAEKGTFSSMLQWTSTYVLDLRFLPIDGVKTKAGSFKNYCQQPTIEQQHSVKRIPKVIGRTQTDTHTSDRWLHGPLNWSATILLHNGPLNLHGNARVNVSRRLDARVIVFLEACVGLRTLHEAAGARRRTQITNVIASFDTQLCCTVYVPRHATKTPCQSLPLGNCCIPSLCIAPKAKSTILISLFAADGQWRQTINKTALL